MKKFLILPILLIIITIGTYFLLGARVSLSPDESKLFSENNGTGNMKLESSAFTQGKPIPPRYTCDGENINPRLVFSGIPEKSKSLFLVIGDKDVPKNIFSGGVYIHWLIWNIPVTTKGISEGGIIEGIVGRNSSGRNEYMGPCPLRGEHRYHFKLFALDNLIDSNPASSKTEVLKEIKDHIIDEAALVGTYKRR